MHIRWPQVGSQPKGQGQLPSQNPVRMHWAFFRRLPCSSLLSSRSRSRSRSRSPSSKPRERKYGKDHQARGPGPREARGYQHRGFQRPFHFRGRGRGFFPRGRFQRGGGGGGGGGWGYNHHNFRHNWRNFRQCPPQRQQYPHPQWQQQQQHQQQQQQQQQHYPRGRSASPRKRPGVTPPRPIPCSDHSSSSPKSRRSACSSSSHSSCSPKQSATSELANQTLSSNGKEEQLPSKEAGEEEEEEGEEEEVGGGATKDGSNGGKWASLSVCSAGLKKSNPPECSADDGQMTLTSADQSSPAHKITASGVNSGAPSWQGVENKSPSQKSPKAVISGFGIFSKKNNLDGGTSTIPAAFRK